MFFIETNIASVIEQSPIVLDWLNILKSQILKSEFDDAKIKAYYSYGFFVSKSKNNLDKLQEDYEKASKLLFPERLEIEMSKVRVDVSIKLGNLVISNRLPNIPKEVVELVTEITKVRMAIEMEISYDEDISESIPELSGLVSLTIINNTLKQENESVLDMDEILDKISKTGLQSLTPTEKDFLDKKSKDF